MSEYKIVTAVEGDGTTIYSVLYGQRTDVLAVYAVLSSGMDYGRRRVWVLTNPTDGQSPEFLMPFEKDIQALCPAEHCTSKG